jgi:hypothetical protein
MTSKKPSLFSRIGLPLKVGFAFALAAMILAVIGIIRGVVPSNPLSILLALLISGASWGLVSWAVATAVIDVERDVDDYEGDDAQDGAGAYRETTDGA